MAVNFFLLSSFVIVLISDGSWRFRVAADWHHSPSSLLFPPTTRQPDAACDFEPPSGTCDGWLAWPVVSERIDEDTFPLLLVEDRWPTFGGVGGDGYRINRERTTDGNFVVTTLSYLSVQPSNSLYLMSKEIAIPFTRYPPAICFSYYYRVLALNAAVIKVYVLSKAEQHDDHGYHFVAGHTLPAWSEQGKWPNTWNWLVNTVQLSLPRNTTRAAVLFYLQADNGAISLDNIEIFASSCNIRTNPPNNATNNQGANNNNNTSKIIRASESAAVAKVWPGQAIPFEVGIGFSIMQQVFLVQALQDLSLHTCLEFKRRSHETDYVQFVHTAEGCTSQRIGYYGGKQLVYLADNCFDKSTLIHEVLHVVGLYHEHQRPERDEYIAVLFQNVEPAYKEQFSKYSVMDSRLTSVRYDYSSVMHYRDNAFVSRRGLKSMVAKDSPSIVLGNIQGPVKSDYQKVANLYCGGLVKRMVEPLLPKSPAFRPRIWEHGDIPVVFSHELSAEQLRALQSVMSDLNSNTCLRFRPRIDEADYVYFQLTGSECYSGSGKLGGRQVVSLYPGNCFTRPLIFWLVLHAIGLEAEHRRPDRDEYVDVNVDNIADDHMESFQKFEAMDWRVMSVPYDVASVLHYSAYAFSKSKNMPTVTSKENSSASLGNRLGPTALDYAKIIRLYNCSIQYWKDLPNYPGSPTPNAVRPSSSSAAASATLQPLSRFRRSTESPTRRFKISPTSNSKFDLFDSYSSLKMVAPLWNDNRIPYVLEQNQFTLFEARRIAGIINNFNVKTCLQFVPRTNEVDFVAFAKNDPLNARFTGSPCRTTNYGRKGGRQMILLPSSKCFTTNFFIYLALLGTAGIPEEHRRPDRDNFIEIQWENIADNANTYFSKYTEIDWWLASIEYDINSLTHYSGETFTKQPGLKTILAKNNASLSLGNSIGPSSLDYNKIEALYC